ncbi:nitrate/nitrite transporter NrtS [Planctobacterium marinum]|uniref:nitrate/nitrite transporter NrtS n=1 Tax=Planctobacterium marinum TaxID=1631968 RepID=UPI001E5E3F43|nr:nitrate/nitrite transporter NrtS [Planctobacterium marinum]MCC2606522.1 nitrate/nitrite transporter NrtS [Planctobacterium marinum]
MLSSRMWQGIKTALVVGTVLLCINQYEVLLGQASIQPVKAILGYCVPFLVFLYGTHATSSR